MQKIHREMDLEEWEFLPDDGFIDYHEDGPKKMFSSKRSSNTRSVFNMNHFECPSSPRVVPNHIVRVPFQLEPPTIDKAPHDDELEKKQVAKLQKQQITKLPVEVTVVPSAALEKIKVPNIGSLEADQDAVSQVFFKKMKENEFVDMKLLDSPKSNSTRVLPQIDAGTFNFDDKSEPCKVEATEMKNSPKNKELVGENGNLVEYDAKKEEVTWEENNGGLNLWKLSLTGIGAICSFGVAAATICIIIFGSQQRNKQHQQNQKLRFQIYTDDKRIKQVVHHATRLNEAISAVRGVPMTRAHVTFGGYYDGL